MAWSVLWCEWGEAIAGGQSSGLAIRGSSSWREERNPFAEMFWGMSRTAFSRRKTLLDEIPTAFIKPVSTFLAAQGSPSKWDNVLMQTLTDMLKANRTLKASSIKSPFGDPAASSLNCFTRNCPSWSLQHDGAFRCRARIAKYAFSASGESCKLRISCCKASVPQDSHPGRDWHLGVRQRAWLWGAEVLVGKFWEPLWSLRFLNPPWTFKRKPSQNAKPNPKQIITNALPTEPTCSSIITRSSQLYRLISPSQQPVNCHHPCNAHAVPIYCWLHCSHIPTFLPIHVWCIPMLLTCCCFCLPPSNSLNI